MSVQGGESSLSGKDDSGGSSLRSVSAGCLLLHPARVGATPSARDHVPVSALLATGLELIAEGRAVFLLGLDRIPYPNCPECWKSCTSPEDRAGCGHPFCHGFYAATLDADRFTDNLAERPDSALAVRTGAISDLIVIDVDMKDGKDGWAALDPYRVQFGIRTRTVVTASGGAHLWLGGCPGVPVGCSASKLGTGLDVRGDGGYVVVPPTAGYRWGRPKGSPVGVQACSPDLAAVLAAPRPAGGRTRAAAGPGGGADRPALGQLRGCVENAPEG